MRQGPQLGHHGKRAGGRRQGPEQGRQAEGCRQDSGGGWQEVHGEWSGRRLQWPRNFQLGGRADGGGGDSSPTRERWRSLGERGCQLELASYGRAGAGVWEFASRAPWVSSDVPPLPGSWVSLDAPHLPRNRSGPWKVRLRWRAGRTGGRWGVAQKARLCGISSGSRRGEGGRGAAGGPGRSGGPSTESSRMRSRKWVGTWAWRERKRAGTANLLPGHGVLAGFSSCQENPRRAWGPPLARRASCGDEGPFRVPREVLNNSLAESVWPGQVCVAWPTKPPRGSPPPVRLQVTSCKGVKGGLRGRLLHPHPLGTLELARLTLRRVLQGLHRERCCPRFVQGSQARRALSPAQHLGHS